ncbi:cytochrome and DOMON domain-containing protein knickkopf [Lycorma delicatula]|uniref:cytochrome and DOMON domain-containing protein knickkopf n=1 Tax=Lycorma delicatula TaxID=130591 RepID=UPI003F5188E3
MRFWFVLLAFLCGVHSEKYRGKYLGKLNSYHHQVSGDVYAVDAYTLLLTGFNYDGNGPDTFFWAGASNRPGPQGFIVPDEHGKTNILDRYFNKDFTVTLPDHKKITDIKWFAIYDLSTQNAFGDVYIPEEFEPPETQKISQLSKRSNGVSSGSLEIIDAKTIMIPDFTYNGAGKDTYFWVGVGPQPSSKGFKVPDEYGYLEPLRLYSKETITLELPGDLTVFDLDWLSVYNVETKENFGSVILPDNPNVPPSLAKIVPHKSTLPNCIQLHKDLQASWEIFGPQITIQLAGQVGEDWYMAFGLSGSREKPQMLGSDIAIAYIDNYRGYAVDYNITANSPCVKVLGQYKGVCRDDLVGGIDNNQLHTFTREDGINYITYRRTLISSDEGDKEFKVEGTSQLTWALGRLDDNKEPSFHDVYPRGPNPVELGRKEPYNSCYSFTRSTKEPREPWDRPKIIDKALRTYIATLGPSGGQRGYQGITGMPTSGLAWYINGLLIPEIWMKRGFTYAFHISGGNNPHSAEYYNPFIITDEPHGGVERLSEAAQKQIRVLGGVQYTLRGQPRPTSAGPLCLGRHRGVDRRLDDDFPTFRKFNKSLSFFCEPGEPAVLEVTPNSSWPDIVYYNSYTHSNMGWKIHIVDDFIFTPNSSPYVSCTLFSFVLPFLLSLLFIHL